MQRLTYELVHDMRPVKVTGVDVVGAGRDGFAKQSKRQCAILGWTEHAGTGQLHRAIAHVVHGGAPSRNELPLVIAGFANRPICINSLQRSARGYSERMYAGNAKDR